MKLRTEMEKAKIGKEKFAAFMHGETRIIAGDGHVQSTHQNKIA